MSDRHYLTVTESAKFVREALKKAFPGVKFSVRSKSYSGGASIDVDWTDGPTSKDVNPVIQQFSGAGFDGMQDLKYSYSHWLMPDGSTKVAQNFHNIDGTKLSEKPHPDAKLVHFQADYVFGHRTLSKALMVKAADLALRTLNMNLPEQDTLTGEDLVIEHDYKGHKSYSWNPLYSNRSSWKDGGGAPWVSDRLSDFTSRLRGDGTLLESRY